MEKTFRFRMDRLVLRDLRVFVAVAREGHFGRAAEMLGLNQPLVSLTVRKIEKAVGERLFVRRPAVKLTPAGEVMVRHALAAMDELENSLVTIGQLREGRRGKLRIGFPTWLAATFIPDAIAAFQNTHPKVEISYFPLSTAEQLAALHQRKIDIGFVREQHCDGLTIAPLLTEPFSLVLPDHHRLAGSGPVSLGELNGERVLLFPREYAPGLYDIIRGVLASAPRPPKVLDSAPDWLAILALVRGGAGVALAPQSLASIALPRVHFADLEDVSITSTLSAVTGPELNTPVLRIFMQILVRWRSEDPEAPSAP